MCWIRSTRACFDYISLIRSRNRVPFFHGLLVLQIILCRNFKIFLNQLDQLASSSTGSSSQLVWSTDFGDFGAQFLHGLGPWALDQFWAVFWIHFGPYFGFLATHHESIWILGGKASWKLKIVSLHGKWGEKWMGKLISRLTGALSRAWKREKWKDFDGWRSRTIKEEKIIFERIASSFF